MSRALVLAAALLFTAPAGCELFTEQPDWTVPSVPGVEPEKKVPALEATKEMGKAAVKDLAEHGPPTTPFDAIRFVLVVIGAGATTIGTYYAGKKVLGKKKE